MAHSVFDVTSWPAISEEQLGSKDKVWLLGPASRRWLFKHPRPTSGEHWAEKIACGVAGRLGLPHAEYDLAVRGGVPGIVVLDFTDERRRGELWLGNMLMPAVEPAYESARPRPVEHRVESVVRILQGVPPNLDPVPAGIETAADVFVGYLLLDALVGNTDRHHENWGLLVRITPPTDVDLELAPTFDHASSLGRELTDAARVARLSTKDRGFDVEAYCRRAGSKFFHPTDQTVLSVRAAFGRAAALLPTATAAWRTRLAEQPIEALHAQVDAIPDEIMSGPAKRFAEAVLECNRRHLLATDDL